MKASRASYLIITPCKREVGLIILTVVIRRILLDDRVAALGIGRVVDGVLFELRAVLGGNRLWNRGRKSQRDHYIG